MQRNPNSPLGDQHLAQIKDAQNKIDAAESQIILATQAGIDVTASKAKLDDSKARLQKIRTVYFPNE